MNRLNIVRREFLAGISFDDGPNEEYTSEVLKILKEYNTQATFFWIVKNAIKLKNEKPDIFAKILTDIKNDGHEIGLHAPYDYKPSMRYRIFGKFTKQEIANAKEELEKLINLPVNLYRPHYLQLGRSVSYAKKLGMTAVWGDFIHYASPDANINKQIKKFSAVGSGNILIFHDDVSFKTKDNYIVDVLPIVLQNLKQKNIKGTKITNIRK